MSLHSFLLPYLATLYASVAFDQAYSLSISNMREQLAKPQLTPCLPEKHCHFQCTNQQVARSSNENCYLIKSPLKTRHRGGIDEDQYFDREINEEEEMELQEQIRQQRKMERRMKKMQIEAAAKNRAMESFRLLSKYREPSERLSQDTGSERLDSPLEDAGTCLLVSDGGRRSKDAARVGVGT
eukprot:CAMPEP_0113663400 /NCGR_PEP_ID=MMETSP0038_2-20120614/1121_1 /TAXON_ID=2898 /ORGANISM="Cryptomonas paramecium" /LENGTH=182 /DNA_ID=CAMNT_0000578423 /DNA_START=16 /DNA_END=560 /DNA_ORIENTATION=- /assembly_acc=CAM_ASM_000170